MKKFNLTTVILTSLLIGAIFGILIYYFIPSGYFRDTILIDGILNFVGNGFIRLMQMLVVPLVFCSLVCGSMAIGDTKTLGKVGVKTVCFYLFTTALAIALALGLGILFKPGIGMDLTNVEAAPVETVEPTSFTDTFLNMIPKNPFTALSEGNMLQVIIFAIFVGILIAGMKEKAKTLSKCFEEFNELMMRMTMAVMKLAPIGVFCLIARTFANLGIDAILPMLKYFFVVMLALFLQGFGVYQILLKLLSGLNPIRFIRKFFPVMLFAFSTSSSNATIPLSIETLDNDIGVSDEISSFTIPLGATINMDGTAIMQGVAVCFVAQAYGINLTPIDYMTVIATATLASVGTAGVPSVGLITLSMVFASVGLPVEGIGIIMGIDRLLDMTRTAINVTGDAVCTTIVAKQEGMFDKEVFDSNKEPVYEVE